MSKKLNSRPLKTSEEIAADVDRMFSVAEEEARRIDRDDRSGRVRRERADLPDIESRLRDEYQTLLEDEFVLVTGPSDSAEGLASADDSPFGLERDVMKKALMGLRAKALRDLAARSNLETRGTIEALAESIAQTYKWDSEQIALLVLANEPEPAPERSHTERVFLLDDTPDLERVAMRIEPMLHRFARIGVARWFMTDDFISAAGSAVIRGSVHAYQPFVSSEDSPHVTSSPSRTEVEIELRDDSRALRIRGRGEQASKSAALAAELALGLEILPAIPYRQDKVTGPERVLARESLFMLDLLWTRLVHDASIRINNVTTARFRMTQRDDDSSDDARPTLRAVRIEGSHLLDSVEACRLISIEGRALVQMSFVGSVPLTKDEAASFPVSVTLEANHITVTTGWGHAAHEASTRMHRSVVDAAIAEAETGIADPARLHDLTTRIATQAKASPTDIATMLTE